MESHVKFLGHPVHPMLIVFPLGLLATATVFDVLHVLGGSDEFATFSFWALLAGLVGGVVAGVFGLLDWLHIPSNTRAKVIGAWHGAGNLIVSALFLVAWLLRRNAENPDYDPSGLPLVLEVVGLGLASVTGWLGGELVDRLGVGVDRGAHVDSPSSLSDRPASDRSSERSATP